MYGNIYDYHIIYIIYHIVHIYPIYIIDINVTVVGGQPEGEGVRTVFREKVQYKGKLKELSLRGIIHIVQRF